MRAIDAKTIPIAEYLLREGLKPSKQRLGGKELWYCSPLRAGDSNPSFKVDTEYNIWYDHGLAAGGNILDLVCALQNATFKEALRILEQTGLYSRVSSIYSNDPTLISEQTPETIAVEKEKQSEVGFDINPCLTLPFLLFC